MNAIEITVKKTNWERQMIEYFQGLPDGLRQKAVKPAIRQTALMIKRYAQEGIYQGTPKSRRSIRTGTLRKHLQIVMARTGKGKPVVAFIGIPRKSRIMSAIDLKKHGKHPFYWLFLERGTGKMRPRRYLSNAHKRALPMLEGLMTAGVRSFMASYRGGKAS